MREDLKPHNLSFTEIAKRVGEQWQLLAPEVKGQYESQAASAKEKYRADLELYKKTDKYREHNEYLAEFKQRNADDKQPRLQKELSAASSQSGPEQNENVEPKTLQFPSRTRRADSFGSMNTYSTTSEHPSPPATNTSKALPSLFAGPPHFGPASPMSSSTSNSPWNHRGSSAVNPVFAMVDKPPPPATDPQNRMLPVDRSEPRTSSSHLANLLQDSDMLRARSSPLAMLPCEPSQSSNSSPISSAFSNNTSQLPAHSSSLTSVHSSAGTTPPADNIPSSRRLPPLSTLVKANSDACLPHVSQPMGHPHLRPDFGPVSLPPPISTPIVSGATSVRHTQTAPEPGNAQPSFKGEYEPKSRFAREASFKSDYDTEASPSPMSSDADPLSVLAYAGRMVDREEKGVRSRRGGRGTGGDG